MIDIIERIFASANYESVRNAFVARTRLEKNRITGFDTWMLERGYVLIDAPTDQFVTEDGREILRSPGKSWVLRPEVHAERLAEAMAQARRRDELLPETSRQDMQHSNEPEICNLLIDGQLCGGNLVTVRVCPSCALGKSGIAATQTCEICGKVTAIMRGGE